MLRSRRCSPMRARICACTVTSSAVVGSSANSSFGPQARAMAIITRWRMPPGQLVRVLAQPPVGSGMRTSVSSRSAVAVASPRDMPRWLRSGSAIWSPTRISGLSELIGSWKTIAIAVPHTSRSSASGRPTSSSPSSRTEPERTTSGPDSRPMIERLSTVLPEPDSPTMPTASPRSHGEGHPVDGAHDPTRRCGSG